MAEEEKKHLDMDNTELPLDPEGRTMHLSANKWDMANRIITVGAYKRAETMSKWLDPGFETKVLKSERGFHIYTGMYKGKPLSVVGTGMGIAMTDFLMREARIILRGPMAVIRFGTCGIIRNDISVGDMICATDGSALVIENYDYDPQLGEAATGPPYHISKALPCSKPLNDILVQKMALLEGGADRVKHGVDMTTESFYGSQARLDKVFFNDYNEDLVERIVKLHPTAANFEMETATMFKLGQKARKGMEIHTAAACIGLFHRETKKIVDEARVTYLESEGGKMVLETLAAFEFPEGEPKHSADLIGSFGKK